MKRLFIVVEGQTEEAFVNELMSPYFIQNGIYDVRPVLIQTSKGHKGGFVNYEHLKNDCSDRKVKMWLYQHLLTFSDVRNYQIKKRLMPSRLTIKR